MYKYICLDYLNFWFILHSGKSRCLDFLQAKSQRTFRVPLDPLPYDLVIQPSATKMDIFYPPNFVNSNHHKLLEIYPVFVFGRDVGWQFCKAKLSPNHRKWRFCLHKSNGKTLPVVGSKVSTVVGWHFCLQKCHPTMLLTFTFDF